MNKRQRQGEPCRQRDLANSSPLPLPLPLPTPPPPRQRQTQKRKRKRMRKKGWGADGRGRPQAAPESRQEGRPLPQQRRPRGLGGTTLPLPFAGCPSDHTPVPGAGFGAEEGEWAPLPPPPSR